MQNKIIDHLFRHHHGKMVSILTRIFGLNHLETIEDAIQDTFIQAAVKWRNNIPEHPEAWLTQASKNRVLDIFRQIKSSKDRELSSYSNIEDLNIDDFFLDSEIEDSQLRMIFTACHPQLHQFEQIVFALKTVAGFSTKEIASALLTKEDTIKKRLYRAKKTIQEKNIAFKIPTGNALPTRLDKVLDVLYLIFNEGFHSNKQEVLIRKELCGEAIRLCKIILKNQTVRNAKSYALFSLMCLHAARIDSKLSVKDEIVDLKNQDRKLWYQPLIKLGENCLYKAMETHQLSNYHYEALIISEHVKADSFNKTNWNKILYWYDEYTLLYPTPMLLLNKVMVYLQLNHQQKALKILKNLHEKDFNQRMYLLYGAWAEYYITLQEFAKANQYLQKAINNTTNELERSFLKTKQHNLMNES